MRDDARKLLATVAPIETAPSTRLRGNWLWAGRVGWLALFLLATVPFFASLPDYIVTVTHLTPDDGASRALLNAGISLTAYGWMSFIILSLVTLISLILSLLLAWRRSDDWMALAISLFIIVNTVSNIGIPQNGADTNPSTFLAAALSILESAPALIITFGVLLLFPTGRFAPRWTWIIFVALSLWALVVNTFPALFEGALFLGYPVAILVIIACMVYRYRCVSTPTERFQTKWIVGGLVVTLVANQVFWIPTGFTPLGQTLYSPLVYLVYQLTLALVPISFFIAIQRYRLYDIDTIINRALVYGALTITLVGVYAVCVIGGQALLSATAFSADIQQNPLIIVATTLLVAALVRPVRAGLQRFVDRRFYRSKYDAARTVATFSATLREEVDLVTLQERLLATVEETLQPAHVSIWLMTPSTPPHTDMRRPG